MSAKRAQEPRVRRPMSAAQRAKLSARQKAYRASDPRRPAHRQKLVDKAKRRTLLPHEIAAFLALQRQGWTFKHIARQIRINDSVLRRELRAKGVATAPGNGRMTLLPSEVTANPGHAEERPHVLLHRRENRNP